MTDQYLNTNINSPKIPKTISASSQLTLDDDLVIVDSLLSSVNVTLPIANQIPGSVFTIKAPSADINTVTIIAATGQNIDGMASFVLNSPQQSLTVQSDGLNWRIIGSGGTASSSARLYDAIVDAAGGADFTLISAAFNSGAQSVFVRSGNYFETANISIPSGGCPIGESPGSVLSSYQADSKFWLMEGRAERLQGQSASLPGRRWL